MSKLAIKQRWQAWENSCIQRALEEKIQHKIIAHALGKSLASVSKKINTLRLRLPLYIKGHFKKSKPLILRKEKIASDMKKMNDILQAHAPLSYFEKKKLSLKEGHWTIAKPLFFSKDPKIKLIDKLQKERISYSFIDSLEYDLSLESPKRGKVETIVGDPLFVSLSHVEKWAVSEGFHRVRDKVQNASFSYWKDGKYFSKAQLLIYLNKIRLERKLQPLSYFEEEMDLYTEGLKC